MVRVSDEETAWRVFRALEAIRGVYYLQRAIPHEGRDVRAFVIGDRVVAAIERRSPAGARTSRAAAKRRAIVLPAAWSDMALRAAQAVGADIRGCRSSACAGWNCLRSRGERNSGMARTSGGDLRKRRGSADRSRGLHASRARRDARSRMSTREEIAAAAQLACLLEASAPKPGNVSPGICLPRHALRALSRERRSDRSCISRCGHAVRWRHDPARDRGHAPLDEREYEPRHRPPPRAARARCASATTGITARPCAQRTRLHHDRRRRRRLPRHPTRASGRPRRCIRAGHHDIAHCHAHCRDDTRRRARRCRA